jgi:hypothetical protein
MSTQQFGERAAIYSTILQSFSSKSLQVLCHERGIEEQGREGMIGLLVTDLDINDPHTPSNMEAVKGDIQLEIIGDDLYKYSCYDGSYWRKKGTSSVQDAVSLLRGVKFVVQEGKRRYYRKTGDNHAYSILPH